MLKTTIASLIFLLSTPLAVKAVSDEELGLRRSFGVSSNFAAHQYCLDRHTGKTHQESRKDAFILMLRYSSYMENIPFREVYPWVDNFRDLKRKASRELLQSILEECPDFYE